MEWNCLLYHVLQSPLVTMSQKLSFWLRRRDAPAGSLSQDAEEMLGMKHQTIKTVRRMRSGVPGASYKQGHLPTIWRHCRW